MAAEIAESLLELLQLHERRMNGKLKKPGRCQVFFVRSVILLFGGAYKHFLNQFLIMSIHIIPEI